MAATFEFGINPVVVQNQRNTERVTEALRQYMKSASATQGLCQANKYWPRHSFTFGTETRCASLPSDGLLAVFPPRRDLFFELDLKQEMSARIRTLIKRKRMGNYRIDPTFPSLPFLNSAAVDPSEPAPF